MPGSFSLIIEDDAGKQIVVPFARDVMTIGRKEGNTIRLTERNVSRFHAKLLKEGEGVHVEDLTSFNGVKLNGDRISGRVQVAAGDVIEIGDYHLELRSAHTDSPATQKMGPAGAKSAGVAPQAAADDDEFEGDTQRWEPPAGAAAVSVSQSPPTQEDRAVADFGENNGDTERLDLEKLSSVVGPQGQSWPAPEGRAPVPSLTTADMEPTARQPMAAPAPAAPAPAPAPTPPLLTEPVSPALAPTMPMAAPVGLAGPALASPTAPTAPVAPAPAMTSPVADADDAPDDATQDMPLPAVQQARAALSAQGVGTPRSPVEQTEQLRAAPGRNPADDVSIPRLVVLNTVFSGSTFPLRTAEAVLGRTDDNDIVLEHRSVSRNHAKLVRDGERVRILDLKSANGVLVNGDEVEQHVLRSGDVIELGRVKIRFVPVGERFVVPPEEIERARIQDAAGDDEDDHGQTLNVAAPMRGPDAAPVATGNKPVALYAVLAILLIAVIVLAVMVISGQKGDAGGGPPPGTVGATEQPSPRVVAVAASTPTPPDADNQNDTDDKKPDAKPDAAALETLPEPAPIDAVDEQPDAPTNADTEDGKLAATVDDGDDAGDDDTAQKPRTRTRRPKKPAEPSVENVDALIKEGQQFMLLDRHAAAIPVFKRAVKASPSNAEAHYLLGNCYSRLRDSANARVHLKRYLELLPYGQNADRVRAVLAGG